LEKLKILLVMLVSAASGLAVSGYILALILTPAESPLQVLAQLLTNGFPATFPFLVLPEMKNYYHTSGNEKENNVSIVLKTLKPEERNIVGVLDQHGGTYLQKFITKEAGLSRLKTHRVVAALSERGVVIVEKYGNTNQVSLVKWFHDGMHNQQPT